MLQVMSLVLTNQRTCFHSSIGSYATFKFFYTSVLLALPNIFSEDGRAQMLVERKATTALEVKASSETRTAPTTIT